MLNYLLRNVAVPGLIMVNYFQLIIQVSSRMAKVKYGHVMDVQMALNVKLLKNNDFNRKLN
jgi:hypothetical protein